MQQCGDCLKVYDESEDVTCPFCLDDERSNSFTDQSCEVCYGEGIEECTECNGEGIIDYTGEKCLGCNGTGERDCLDCNGTGL